MLGGIGAAVFIDNLLVLFKYFISLPAIFGAAIWLGFVWRKLSKWAVIIQVILCTLIYILIPNTFPAIEAINGSKSLLLETKAQEVMIKTGALAEDIEADRATKVGQTIEKRHLIEPVGVFFEKVVRKDPQDPNSPKMGIGRFHAELWVISWFSWLGFDLAECSKAMLVALRFAFDAFFPFVILFMISFFTKPASKKALDSFYSKIHTPVQATLEEDARVVAENAKQPEIFEKDKIWPNSNWEILKPNWYDHLGFWGSWVVVGLIIFILWLVVTVY